ncbi:type III secretion protein [Dyella sp. M7H15-1]|uniref:type III secretion protein n=1 Tax=Dyella sp. M7H15-1 TaxID=2501295 RepID=UPI0010051E7B|nr:type III secretion protein [Dyella sp. M7H15-1]QAU24336.1 type III secretion protein [Dyella sp. M7H15-1]
MELQWQRQVEYWLRLMSVERVAARENMMVQQGKDVFYLERENGRAKLTVARQVPDAQSVPTLLRLMLLLQPEAANGVPMRTWLARNQLWLAATAPAGSGAELWHQLGKLQQRLLNRVTVGIHANT